MKQIIKTLALSLIVSLGLVACNDNEDFDNFKVTYPSEMPTGFFESGHTMDSYEYSALLQDENGINTCQIFRKNKKDNSEVTILCDTIAEYNDTIGVFTTTNEAENNYFEKDAEVGFFLMKNGEMILQIKAGGMTEANVSLHKSNGIPTVASIWANDEFTVLTELTTDTITGTEDPNFDNKLFGVIVLDDMQIPYAYTYENGKGELLTVDGQKGSFEYDKNYNLLFTLGKDTFKFNRLYSTPAPEVFNTIATGTMKYGVQSFADDGSVLFDESMSHKAELGVSAEDPSRYCIKPWLKNPNGLVVIIDKEGNLTIPKQFTGFASQNYGDIFGQDLATAMGVPEMAGSFDGKVLIMPMAYLVSAGAVGLQLDGFVVEEAVQTQSANTMKSIQTKCVNSMKKFIKVNNLVELKK